jgi:hypothetical protein
MKKNSFSYHLVRSIILYSATLLLFFGLNSCSDEYIGTDNKIVSEVNTPIVGSTVGSSDTKFLFGYDKDDSDVRYKSRYIDSQFGSVIAQGDLFTLGEWNKTAGVQSGNKQFLFLHKSNTDNSDNKRYEIREILSSGQVGKITESGEWNKNYEQVVGFRVGEKGFIFGQDSYGDHYWFVQEITSFGKLGAETDNGSWNNFYKSATPLYVNGQTYLFFHTENDCYWFISRVSQEGKLTDVCDGHWGSFWDYTTSVETGGKTYLVGHQTLLGYNTASSTGKVQWFIQLINSDGSMGPETDRGIWANEYHILCGYTIGGQAYIFGHNKDNGGLWFIQNITADGKLGAETCHGTIDSGYDFFFPFNIYDPGGFRYTIGWDLSKTSGSPTRSWSSMFLEPWSRETKFGGGAALADIDMNGKYDAILAGIQDQPGVDRFYYKVAWNLDNTGKAASWSQAFYGPYCGEMQAGGGADIADIDRNGVPDLVLMSVDDPSQANSFRYYIGWNLNTSGKPASWSSMIQLDGLGWDNAGGGLALGDLDGNGITEMVLTAIDNPGGANRFWYKVGRNLDQTGKAASWTSNLFPPFYVGDLSAGGGAALADVNGNGKPDLVLMDIDSPQGANPFWCYIGWDIDTNGNVAGWSSFTGPSLGSMTSGGGAAIGDIDKNGILDLLLMTVDNPYGND